MFLKLRRFIDNEGYKDSKMSADDGKFTKYLLLFIICKEINSFSSKRDDT